MSAWDTYAKRIGVRGGTKREASRRVEISRLKQHLPDNLSYQHVELNGVEQDVEIINTENLSTKKIRSMPGESLIHGGLVDWKDSKWLITELDAHDELYESGVIERCNQLVKWVTPEGDWVERWGIVVDGTKYLIGENTKKMMTIGDARMSLTIAKDDETKRLHTGTRMFLGDPDAEQAMAYEITKPNTLYNVYNGEGVYRYILNQVVIVDEDDTGERMADAEGRGFKDPVTTPEHIRETGVYI